MHNEVIGNTSFTFRVLDSDDRLDDIFSLRYQVYCRECRFIREADYPEAKEQDKYDPHSLQFSVEDHHGLIGAARLILHSPIGFPLEEHCGDVLTIDKDSLPREQVAEISRLVISKDALSRKQLAEISRLVISKEYRRRGNDGLYYAPSESSADEDSRVSQRVRPMVFGLYREIYQESKRRGIKYWYAVMEPSLWTLLKINGFIFHSIGEEVDYYGPVRPYMGSIDEIERSVQAKFPYFFDVYLLDGLERKYWPEFIKKAGLSERGIYETFRDRAREQHGSPAIYYKTEEGYRFHSYGEFHDEVVRTGNYLHRQGVRELDKVDILLWNSPSWPLVFMAIQYLNAIAVPLDITLSEEELRARVSHCNPKMLLCDEKISERMPLFIEKIKKSIPVVVIDNAAVRKEIDDLPAHEIAERTLPLKNQAAVFFFTSGTTASPKVVMLSHENLIANASAIAKEGSLKSDDNFICMLPLYHSYPLMTTCILPLLFGAKISFPPAMNTADLLECMRSTRITFLTGVPQIFSAFHSRIKDRLSGMSVLKRLILAVTMEFCWFLRKYFKLNPAKVFLGELHDSFSARLKVMITGGAHLDKKITLDLFKWGFTVLEGYGLSETSPIVSWNTRDNWRIGSVGKPLPGVQVRFSRLDKQGAGELMIKGPNVMLGYYQNPEATKNCLADGWFSSGDIGYLDKDGYLYILGRRDEIVVLDSGKKASLDELESYYGSSRYVKEICVLALTQKGLIDKSKQLVAVVVPDLKRFSQDADQAAIEQAVRDDLKALSEGLSEHKRIRGLFISGKILPRTSLGKLMRHKVERNLTSLKKPVEAAYLMRESDTGLAASPEVARMLEFLSKKFKRKVSMIDHLEMDLGLDSLGRIELLLELQREFQVNVSDSEAVEFSGARTVQDLMRKIKPFMTT